MARFVYISRFVWLCFFSVIFGSLCLISLSHSLCLSAHCCSPLSFFQRATGFVYPTKSGKEEEEIAAANVACIFRLTVEYFRFLFRSNQYCCQKTVVHKSGIGRRGRERGAQNWNLISLALNIISLFVVKVGCRCDYQTRLLYRNRSFQIIGAKLKLATDRGRCLREGERWREGQRIQGKLPDTVFGFSSLICHQLDESRCRFRCR